MKRLQIQQQLTEFPRKVFDHADTLEILDLGNNQLSDLPDDFARLKKLKILFLTNNHFTHIPAVLAQCPVLEMIAFKDNQLTEFAENSIPEHTRWLILTGNQLTKLPDSMGKLYRLQKLALAGNQLTALPDSMATCHKLELIRLSANRFQQLPDWLFELPRLSWLAFAGNPFSSSVFTGIEHQSKTVPFVHLSDLELDEKLGEGASGTIYRGHWKQAHEHLGEPDIAVKLFKGNVTSDGYPQDELDCCLDAGHHPHIVKTIGEIKDPAIPATPTAPEKSEQLGIVMELIPAGYHNLGNPPDFNSCSRDTFAEGVAFSAGQIAKIISDFASAAHHLHQQGVSHGDLYAHNTLVNDQDEILLGDFGAASDCKTLPVNQRNNMEKIEVRALGCLLDDLLTLPANQLNAQDKLVQLLTSLRDQCFVGELAQRPGFASIQQSIRPLID